MSKFIARIELYRAGVKDYEILSGEIEKDAAAGKKRKLQVKADKRKVGAYNYSGNISLGDVAQAISRVVRKSGFDFSFTIMKNKADYKLDTP